MIPKTAAHLLPPNLSLRLLNGYLDSGELEGARNLFDKIPLPNLRLWTLLISAYTKRGLPKESIRLYREVLREKKLKPDKLALLSVVKACAISSDLKDAREIHEDAIRLGLQTDVVLGNALIDMYGKCGFPQGARSVFDGLPERDVISWTSVISAFVNSSLSADALQVFYEMGFCGLRPNSVTLSSVLPACSDLKAVKSGREIHCFTLRNGFQGNVFVSSGLVDMYAKCSRFRQARFVFDHMPWRDAISWNVILAAYFSNGESEEALGLFNQMRSEGVKMNLTSWNSVIGGCVQNGRVEEAFSLLGQMQHSGFKPDLITIASMLPACTNLECSRSRGGKEIHAYSIRHCFVEGIIIVTALTLMYAKCGELDISRRIFRRMPRKDVVAWNTVILANSMHGCGEEALSLFQEMVDSGVKPNSVTFIGVLTGCSHSQLVDEAYSIFNSMIRDHGVEPDVDHYSCMVDVLSRAGLLKEAYGFLQEMPLEPTPRAWGAFLAGCKVYKDVALGTIAAKRLFEIEPDNPGNYVLLSNIFGAAKLWDDASMIRKQMRERGITKVPGCSWIQIKNHVYTFVKGDERNARSDEIYGFLEGMKENMRLEGYQPDTDFHYLEDVDADEMKYCAVTVRSSMLLSESS